MKGKIYVKLKDAVSIPNVGSGGTLNKAGELPFIQSLLGDKAIALAQKPFFTPTSERLQRIYKLDIAQPDQIDEILKVLNQDPNVEYAERVPIRYTTYVPSASSSK